MVAGARDRPLVLDDDPLVLRAIGRELAPGFDVVTAADPDRAADYLAAHDRIAAVVRELKPGPAGAGVFVLEARGIQPDAVRLLTPGAARPEAVQDALRMGIAHKFVPKPWGPGAILKAIGR